MRERERHTHMPPAPRSSLRFRALGALDDRASNQDPDFIVYPDGRRRARGPQGRQNALRSAPEGRPLGFIEIVKGLGANNVLSETF